VRKSDKAERRIMTVGNENFVIVVSSLHMAPWTCSGIAGRNDEGALATCAFFVLISNEQLPRSTIKILLFYLL
jgi:hypothetical protein